MTTENPVPTPAPAPVATADGKPQTAARPRWARVLGWTPRRSPVRFRFLKFRPTFWGAALLLFVIGGAGGGGFLEYSMQPAFCEGCHIMEPYYMAWHNSTHKNVECVKCHFEPGLKNTLVGKFQASSQAIKYITQTYGSKPHAEVHDSSCMREECHQKRLLEGKVNWTIKKANGENVTIHFDHTPHLTMERRGKQLRCVSCHSQIVQGQHLVVTLDTCFLCHFKGLEHGRNDQTLGGCKGCHDAPKSEIKLSTGVFKHEDYLSRRVTCQNCHSEVVKGDGKVNRQVCWTCHNTTDTVARFDETRFVHDQHVTKHKVDCTSCHERIEHNLHAADSLTLNNPATGLTSGHATTERGTCGQCHDQTHNGPAELYHGTGGRGVPNMPSPMYRAQVDCIACHKARENPDDKAEVVGQTFLGQQQSCNYCHGTKYTGALDEWKKQIATAVDKAEIAFNEASDTVKANKLRGSDDLKARRLLDDASHNIRLVKLGHGVHNVIYSTALLNYAIDCSKQAAAIKPVVLTAEVTP